MDSASQRRLAENEAIFRSLNQRIKEKMQNVFAQSQVNDYSIQLYCECSSHTCNQKVNIDPTDYDRIHKNNKHFVIVCGHEVNSVEKVIDKNDSYCIVEKFIDPSTKTDMQLNET